jgi:hypothetical protein
MFFVGANQHRLVCRIQCHPVSDGSQSLLFLYSPNRLDGSQTTLAGGATVRAVEYGQMGTRSEYLRPAIYYYCYCFFFLSARGHHYSGLHELVSSRVRGNRHPRTHLLGVPRKEAVERSNHEQKIYREAMAKSIKIKGKNDQMTRIEMKVT